MHWLEGLPEITAVLLGSALVVAGALWAAVKLDRGPGFAWLFPTARQSPVTADIDRLAALADLARGEGVLALEGQVARRGEEVLAEGVRLLIEGVPAPELRGGMEKALGRATAAELRRGAARWVRLMHTMVFAAAVLGLISVWSLGIAASTTGAAVSGLLLCYASMLALALVGPLCDRAARGGSGAAAMRGLMSLEAVMLIEKKADGRAVRDRLAGLLPPTSRDALAAAA
ncbi:MAG: hypothetical protein WD749_14130 [Phycisphaerales bacterium]